MERRPRGRRFENGAAVAIATAEKLVASSLPQTETPPGPAESLPSRLALRFRGPAPRQDGFYLLDIGRDELRVVIRVSSLEHAACLSQRARRLLELRRVRRPLPDERQRTSEVGLSRSP